jgi:hypothetical protein
VALGGFAQPPFWFQHFSISAFQLLPKGGFAQPPFWFQHFSISAFAQLWLCAALFLISGFRFQVSGFRFQLFSFSAFAL